MSKLTLEIKWYGQRSQVVGGYQIELEGRHWCIRNDKGWLAAHGVDSTPASAKRQALASLKKILEHRA